MRRLMLICLLLTLTHAARAQSLAERLAEQHPEAAQTTIRVAAGVKTKGNYAQIVPIIADQLASSGISVGYRMKVPAPSCQRPASAWGWTKPP